eukprot:CAMPEP_0172606456 /NCGR_PEP_ID=MMETSP1068-20121228/26656_1 /TAXON_ID=35684 /ORGANISM="Pseudopedinella elastica, Strain CCMP716" /LENGTH=352 /DNA_ID=CAMNT_0013409155 /DNA_START=330 /DNA_END=1388 /DNA_ORIENTATION=+
MTASFIFLGSRYSKTQFIGAMIILLGALTAISPSFLPQSPDDDATNGSVHEPSPQLGANILYMLSNVPMALSAVYKEHHFGIDDVHPLFLTQWVSIYQFLFGFLLAPLQLLPGISSRQGMTMSEIGSSFTSGWRCFLEIEGACPEGTSGTFWLMWGYCAVNFVFNTLGLFLTKHGGAALSSISYSMLLPLTFVSNALPCLGPFQESFNRATVAGLIAVLTGFIIYEKDELLGPESCLRVEPRGFERITGEQTEPLGSVGSIKSDRRFPSGMVEAPDLGSPRSQRAPSYQERLVLVPLPINEPPQQTSHLLQNPPIEANKPGEPPLAALELPRPRGLFGYNSIALVDDKSPTP